MLQDFPYTALKLQLFTILRRPSSVMPLLTGLVLFVIIVVVYVLLDFRQKNR